MEHPNRSVVEELMERLVVVEARLQAVSTPVPDSATRRGVGKRAGRKNETSEIAGYANRLNSEGKTWKEVLLACQARWPGNKHVGNAEQVRGIWRRHYKPCGEKRIQ